MDEIGGLNRSPAKARVSTAKNTKKVRYAKLADEPAEDDDLLNDLPYTSS